MITRILDTVLGGLVVFAACAYAWVWHNVHRYGFPTVTSRRINKPSQLIATALNAVMR
jgi:hypothetical protein